MFRKNGISIEVSYASRDSQTEAQLPVFTVNYFLIIERNVLIHLFYLKYF